MKSTAELLNELFGVRARADSYGRHFSLTNYLKLIDILGETLKHIEDIRCTEHTECLKNVEMGMHCAVDKSRKQDSSEGGVGQL